MPDTLVAGVGKGTLMPTGAGPYVSKGGGKVSLIQEGGQNFDSIIDATTIAVLGQGAAGIPELPVTNPTQTNGTETNGDYKEFRVVTKEVRTTTESGQTSETTDTGSADAAKEIAGDPTDAVREAGEQLIPKTAEEMQVDVRTVIDTMGDLLMGAADLLNQESMATLVSAIAGEDETALITDSNLYANLSELSEEAEVLKEGIATEFHLDPDALQDVIDEAASLPVEVPEEGEQTETPVITIENHITQQADVDTDAEAPISMAQGTETITAAQSAGSTPEEAKTDNDLSEAEAGTTENAAPRAEQAVNEQQTGRDSSGSDHRSDADTGRTLEDAASANRDVTTSPETNLYATLVNRVNESLNAVTEANAPQTASYTQQVNAEDVIRQVMDFMRVTIDSEMTEMEMQLHPQSLGKVNVHLASMQNGDIVARFATENEAVRAALESQMPELQKRFNEQGIKVNAVEVTVDQKAFDQNADREAARQDQQNTQGEELRRAGRMRRVALELNGLDAEAIENLNDEDRMTVEMMEAEGSTVNYRA